MTLILGAKKANGRLLEDLRGSIESVPGSGRPPFVQTLDTHLGQTALAPLRVATMMVAVCSTTSLLLSVLGLTGVLSDAARQRRREIAVRIALGARRRHLIFRVMKEAGRIAGAAALTGTLGSRMLSPVPARITRSSRSPAVWVWFAAPLALLGAVSVAAVFPGRRALSVNPATIMRGDH